MSKFTIIKFQSVPYKGRYTIISAKSILYLWVFLRSVSHPAGEHYTPMQSISHDFFFFVTENTRRYSGVASMNFKISDNHQIVIIECNSLKY